MPSSLPSTACEVKRFSKVVHRASASFLWREGGNDFFKPRIAAQRIPHRVQAQVAIAWTAWDSGDGFKLLKRQLTFARPRTDHGKVPFHISISCCVFNDRQ